MKTLPLTAAALVVLLPPVCVCMYVYARSALRGWLLSAFDVRAAAIEVAWRWLDMAGPLNEIAAPSSSSSSGQRPKHQQQLLAMEALTIYCPLGHALGLGVCAAGLEDAAFKVCVCLLPPCWLPHLGGHTKQ